MPRFAGNFIWQLTNKYGFVILFVTPDLDEGKMVVKTGKRKKSIEKLYLIGSLKNKKIRELANKIRKIGFDVFDDWQAAHPEADDNWRDYEKGRGRPYKEALKGHAARHIYEFDKSHLDASGIAVLICPTGKSGHLEAGYVRGFTEGVTHMFKKYRGKLIGMKIEKEIKKMYILLDPKVERWDVMYQFADDIFETEGQLICQLKKDLKRKRK